MVTRGRRVGSTVGRVEGTRVGLFGVLGAGNIGNDGSMESVVHYIREAHPDVNLDAWCTGPDRLRDEYGLEASPMHWQQRYEQRAPQLPRVAFNVVGKGIDAVRTARWVRGHAAVIVPGAGVLEASLPVRPWEIPYSLFLLCVWGRVFRTRVALVDVGADKINKPTTRWLSTMAARLASYRSYRDSMSRTAMSERGVDTTNDHVYPDLMFGLPVTSQVDLGEADSVALGVMAYYGGNDDRSRAGALHRTYVEQMRTLLNWLLDHGKKVTLILGDSVHDQAVTRELYDHCRASRSNISPGLLKVLPVASPRELAEGIKNTRIVVAIRYHNVITALRLSRPTLAISYSPKHEVVMDDMGLSGFCHPAATMNVTTLIEQFRRLDREADTVHRALRERNREKQDLLSAQFADLSDIILSAGSMTAARKREK